VFAAHLGYFICKLKGIEYNFHGDYLLQCQGKRKTNIMWNFQKNPLENMTLSYQGLLDLWTAADIKEENYELRPLKTKREFLEK